MKFPMPAAMPRKIRGGKYRETCRTSDARKTKYARIVEADESARKRLEGTLHKDHEDHIAGKGINSLNHHNLAHRFIPMPEAMNIPDAQAAVDQRMGKTRENTGMAADESQKQKRKNCGKVEADVEPGSAFCGKLSYSAELDCIQSPGDTQSTQSTRFESHSTMCRETCYWGGGSNQNDAA